MTDDTRATLILVLLAATLATLALSGLAQSSEEPPTLRALRAVPVHTTDRDEPPESRDARLRAIAQAIDSATEDRTERAALVVLAWHESHLARFVHEDRCHEGPRGSCDFGKARGVFQLHGDVPPDDEGQAALAARLWRSARVGCSRVVPDELVGAFARYGTGSSCGSTSWARRRAAHVRALRGRL